MAAALDAHPQDLQSLITDRFPLSSAVYAVANVKSGHGIKTVVEPN